MSAGEMMDGFRRVYGELYSLGSIARRMFPPPRGNILESAAYTVANLEVNRFLRKNPEAWGTIQ